MSNQKIKELFLTPKPLIECLEFIASFLKVYKELPIYHIDIHIAEGEFEQPHFSTLLAFYELVDVELDWELVESFKN